MDDKKKQQDIAQLTLDLLRDIRNEIHDLKDGQRLTNERLSSIEHHMSGFFQSSNIQNEEIAALKQRMERIERRLDLHE